MSLPTPQWIVLCTNTWLAKVVAYALIGATIIAIGGIITLTRYIIARFLQPKGKIAKNFRQLQEQLDKAARRDDDEPSHPRS